MAENSKTDLEIETKSNYWLHTGRPVKIAFINALAIIPFLFLLFFPSWKLFYLTIGNVVLMIVLERFGYTPTVAYRMVRSVLGGRILKRNRRIGTHRIWK